MSLTGVQLAQLAVGVLGRAAGHRRVRHRLDPGDARRGAAPAAGAVGQGRGRSALATLVLCLPAVVVAFFAGQSILSAEHLDIGLGEPGVARAVFGSALFLAAVGLLGLGLGALLRNTAGGDLGAVRAAVRAADPGRHAARARGRTRLQVPARAGRPGRHAPSGPDPTSRSGPGPVSRVFCLYTAIVLGLAAWRLRRRDA